MGIFSRILALLLVLITNFLPSAALWGSKKSPYEKELEKREKFKREHDEKLSKQQVEAITVEDELASIKAEQEKNKQELAEIENLLNAQKSKEVHNPALTTAGQIDPYANSKIARENNEKDQKQEKRSESKSRLGENKSEKPSKKEKQKETKKSLAKKSDLDLKREELKANEQEALDFIFPSISGEELSTLSRDNFFSQTEKEQLLELWRATIARNRTIQFIIKSLSANPDEIEANNAVMQVLSRALFVPFYAVSAVANNSLVSGGSAVGARVIGDVVDSVNAKSDRTKEVTRTDMIVLFMLVDEVAERLRTAYYAYKEAKVQKELVQYELIPARMDAAEALEQDRDSSVFFTRMVVRDLERRLRQADLAHMTQRRTLVELAGDETVDSVDLLIQLEVEEMLSDIVGV